MEIFDADDSGSGCAVWRVHHRDDAVGGEAFTDDSGDRARCRIPLPSDPRGKRVRWNLTTMNAEFRSDRHSDFAPDQGWYP
jgi:hypothetical protein